MEPVDHARRINKGQRVFGCEAVPPTAARHKHQWNLGGTHPLKRLLKPVACSTFCSF
jgi:hypothetical protein